jgi:hypothetical protein
MIGQAKIVELIEVVTTEGKGSAKDDPVREITQYWTKDGLLLFKKENN